MKRFIPALCLVLILLLTVGGAAAQTTDTTTTTTGTASSVTIFFVACENQAVVNLSGTMESGLDLYYQVFSGPSASGTSLTSLRQVQVDGAYAVSEVIPFSGGTIPAGSSGSVKVFMAREGNSASTASDIFTATDVQDGCNNPQNSTVSSVDAGAGATTTTTTAGSNIRSPFGGVINFGVPVVTQGEVVLGARQPVNSNRSSTPGVIFAECDSYLPGAAPGLLYDNDNIVIFWSWYARTEAQTFDHIAKAQYSVTLNRAPLVEVVTSPVQKLGTNFWVFYTANIGNLSPGQYGVEYRLTWSETTTDGYDDFGPGTNNVEQYSTCSFTIERNPDGATVAYSNMYSLR
ncbi:MAG: hypothetical protein J0L63_19095 [Anaerolineae bacterium]|nr:hypothetical protein [Anaerolineae bacterium]